MASYGVCEICGLGVAAYSCKICGRKACANCMTVRGVCKQCLKGASTP
ncbi:MAG TPA: orotate phosphoribosyltransferase [Candidatus Altiarchaeales archaeon]|nr:orotate phosphoribosyltransferase [Candidatus Altiarchaeales archaeon]